MIGLGSTTLTVKLYVFVLPFCAVTMIENLFSPSTTLCVPAPLTLAFESFALAFMFICSVLASALAVYSVVPLAKAGDNSKPSIDKLFK